MTEEQIALARRAVACRGWKWMPGMLAVRVEEPPFVSEGFDASKMLMREHRVFGVNKVGLVCCDREAFASTSTAFLPSLQDSATLGCLLALVREAWGDECAGTAYDEFADGWFFKSRVRDGDGGNVCVLGRFRHEAKALVAALEAAP